MTIESGALEQAYAKVESAYGTLPTPASTDAIRQSGLALEMNLNREPSKTKLGTPGYRRTLPRMKSASWSLRPTHWEPSGSLGTGSYFSAMIKAGMGASNVAALSTTVEASPSPSATGCTLTDDTDLQVTDVGVFTVATGARKEVTRIKTLASAAVTFDALSAAPDSTGGFVSGVSYTLASLISESLGIFLFHTGGGKKQAVVGALVDTIEMTFQGNGEAMIAMGGPAANKLWTGFTQPAAHTSVGDPASGLVGNLYLDGSVFLVQKAVIRLSNALELREGELGVATASGFMRGAEKRTVNVEVSYFFDNQDIIDAAEAVTTDALRVLVGNTAGEMVGAVCPVVEWMAGNVPDADGPKVITQTGRALETSGNDELFVGEM